MVIIRTLLLLYVLAIMAVILISWFPGVSDGPLRQVFDVLRRITDPVLQPLRRVIPPVGGVVDLSPTIAIVVLLAIRNII